MIIPNKNNGVSSYKYCTTNFNSIIEKYENLESIYAYWSQRNRIYDPSQPSKLTVK